MNRAIRLVACFEALKGLVVLIAGSGVLLLLHKNLHTFALSLVEHTHLNPASKYPQIFLDAVSNLQDSKLVLLAIGAALYTTLRFVEAFGLLYQRKWAEQLAAGSGAIYLPFELFAFAEQQTLLHGGLLLANLAVVAVMISALRKRKISDQT